jgi:small-conductance mechanosensitive channel
MPAARREEPPDPLGEAYEKLAHPGDTLADVAVTLWRFELFAVEGTSITFGTVVIALGLFLLGALLSRRASRAIGGVMTRRLGVELGVSASLQALLFYALLATFLLLSLRVLNVPLTAFTVLGGGLAIGVGFGSQNIVNNFISGLVLMLERPIKVGDIVDVDGTYGRVQHIGARSTSIATFDNIHIIVPNSSFLEKNVVNWTHSDDVVRTHVEVGVAYGSPTRVVDKLIRRVLKEHGRILDKPSSEVLFTEFGDSALVFRAYFWLRVPHMMDRRRVESDVRFRIDNLFREAGIVIAFPQRDVHLAVPEPVPIRIVPPGEAEPAASTSPEPGGARGRADDEEAREPS